MNVLSLQVLSLNKVYQPMGLISVKEAIDAIFTQRAEIIEQDESGGFSNHNVNSWLELSLLKKIVEEEEIWINSIEPYFIAPKVIRYLNYDKSHIKQIKFNRKNIILRDKNTCIYCNDKFPTEELQLEHIIPKSRGGRTNWTNIASACFHCNQKKGNRTPKEANMKMHWKPIKPKVLPKKNIIQPKYKIWEQFISDMYWDVKLEN